MAFQGSRYIRLAVWDMRRCRAVWEVVGTEPGGESGREGKRDHLVPDSQETAIPVSDKSCLLAH